ncbi:MAG: putative Ig domain-containing protein, partial [Proteobacteria bacterium]|nr:putative Ig domain-containing protein [Pseudomonadota bacterium]
ANGDTLTYSVGTLPSGISYNASTRTLSGTPTVLGTHTITVSVADGRGGTRSTSFTLSVVNNPPVYNGGLTNRTAVSGSAVNWALPGGAFTDPNQDGLTYTLMVERPAYGYDYWPPNGGEPVWRDVDPVWMDGSAAGLSINASTGTITGAASGMALPNATYNAFSYRVKIIASDGSSTVEGIFQTDINTAPTAPSMTTRYAQQGRAFTLAALPAFWDANYDPLTHSVSGLPAGVSFNPTTRVLSGTPTVAGDFTITYTANDGKGGVTSTTFILSIAANNAPTAPSVGTMSATVNAAWSNTLPAFTDPNGDALSYSISGLPAGLGFDPSSRVISGTPTTTGSFTVTYTAADGRGGVTSTTFTITVNNAPVANQPPVVGAPIQDQWAWYNVNWSFTVPANTFSDANGDTLTYSASGMPSGMTFNAATRTFSMYTPRNTSGFLYTLTVTVNDGRGGTASDTFYFSVEPWEGPGGGGGMINHAGETQSLAMGEESSAPVEESSAVTASATTAAVNEVESWYAYDKLNRVSVVNGTRDAGGNIVVAQDHRSYAISYDAAGREVSRQQYRLQGNTWELTAKQEVYSLRGELLLSYSEERMDGQGKPSSVIERRTYDDAGRVTRRLLYFSKGSIYAWVDMEGTLNHTDVGGWLSSAETNTYDADGRLVTRVEKTRPEGTMTRRIAYSQNEVEFPGWVARAQEETYQNQATDLAVLTNVSTISYADSATRGYDAAGRVKGYTYQTNKYTHTYTYAYTGWDSYRESTVTGSSTDNNYKTTISTMTYDAAGRQTEIREHTNGVTMDDRIRSFAYNGDGMILTRRDGTLDGSTFEQNGANGQAATGAAFGRMNLRNVYANGQQVAGLDEAGKIDVLSRLTGFSNTDAGKTQVVAQAGDTLRSLAQRVYGNGNLWYLLAEANGLSGDPGAELVAGASLTVPEATTSSND